MASIEENEMRINMLEVDLERALGYNYRYDYDAPLVERVKALENNGERPANINNIIDKLEDIMEILKLIKQSQLTQDMSLLLDDIARSVSSGF